MNPKPWCASTSCPTTASGRRMKRPSRDLVRLVRDRTGVELDPTVPTLGFARRMTAYKRPDLLFTDLDRLLQIDARHPFQLVMAGKSHPNDGSGKYLIRRIHDHIGELRHHIRIAFLPNYDMELAKTLVSGADVWLNTPEPPLEASGTSGMKAALNGVLNLSVLDGWWVEAAIEGVNGWSIGRTAATMARPARPGPMPRISTRSWNPWCCRSTTTTAAAGSG